MSTAWAAPTADQPLAAAVRLPGSKSMMARALVLGALAAETTTVHDPLLARDSQLMAAGLQSLGVDVSTVDDDAWVIRPRTDSGSTRLTGPARIDVGLSGTVMRFVPSIAGLAEGPITFDGDPYARNRPLGPLLGALGRLGVTIDAAPSADGGGLPLVVHGTGRVAGGEVTIDASASSQFVSGLLLAASAYDKGLVVRHAGPPMPSAPHVRMTVAMLRAAGAEIDDSARDVWSVEPGPLHPGDITIEPDLSGAAPFLAAALVSGGTVTVPGWPRVTTQPGDHLPGLLEQMGASVALGPDGLTVRGNGPIHGITADLSEDSELTMVIAALAALADGPSRLSGIGHIRHHETDRLAALTRELSNLGTAVTELPDGLLIEPKAMTGGTFETYDDHRMAHAAAVLGLAVPGIVLSDIACTSKTMPDFPMLWAAMVRGTDAA